MFSTQVNTMQERAAFIALLARRYGDVAGDRGTQPSVAGQYVSQTIMRVRGCLVVSQRAMSAVPDAPKAQTIGLDVAALAGAFAERLRDADGVAFTHTQSKTYADALQQHMPRSRRSLYYMTREIFVTGDEHAATFNRVFSEVFGLPVGADRHRERERAPALTAVGA
jgi:cytochrome P450